MKHINWCVQHRVTHIIESHDTYHRVTTSLLYVFVGIDLARAKPVSIHFTQYEISKRIKRTKI